MDSQTRYALVVDDEEAIGRAHARALAAVGFQVSTATSGQAAIEALALQTFDVILSDIDMPGMSGIALLERVRQHDGDVPVIMITGQPSLETAVAAIEYGALRYLTKPINLKDLTKVAEDAVRLYRLAKAKRQALELAGGPDRFIGDRAGLVASFERALASLYIAYQPIVSWSARKIFGYEALLRSREPALPHPGAMLDAAERLGRIHELGARIRSKAIEPLERMEADAFLFINLHPYDLADERLFSSETPLARAASRIVLEITERAALEGIRDVHARAATLRALGFRLAIDDLGAGYAGLASFALLEPNVVKLDLSLVRDLHKHSTKQTLVRTMIAMCKELGLLVIGECIEVPEERDELARAGCDLMQGYLFAKPGDAFPVPRF
ncbi:MAG TPA: EAL domain-containing protein [Polyangiales bacterium]|nr:EAL domain-containing protein [Polyangiales bacterium]